MTRHTRCSSVPLLCWLCPHRKGWQVAASSLLRGLLPCRPPTWLLFLLQPKSSGLKEAEALVHSCPPVAVPPEPGLCRSVYLGPPPCFPLCGQAHVLGHSAHGHNIRFWCKLPCSTCLYVFLVTSTLRGRQPAPVLPSRAYSWLSRRVPGPRVLWQARLSCRFTCRAPHWPLALPHHISARSPLSSTCSGQEL